MMVMIRSAEETRAGAEQKQPAAVARGEKQQPQQQQQNRPQRQSSEKDKGKAPAIPESPKQRQAPSEQEKGKAPALPESPRRQPQPQQQQPAPELQKLMAAAARPELPRILTQLSRKEKEEDWLLMKGTKLPVRPKKRTKAVEKNVSNAYPGQYLGEVTRHRYMVREKKSRKEKRKGGLKAMESDSD